MSNKITRHDDGRGAARAIMLTNMVAELVYLGWSERKIRNAFEASLIGALAGKAAFGIKEVARGP